jgi:methyl-accepting chemotaxis protein
LIGSDVGREVNDEMNAQPMYLHFLRWRWHPGVSILQPEKDVFAPARELKKTFFLFSLFAVAVALLMAVGMSRSIVKPVHELIDATHSIASGDMSRSIGFGGVDEIGMLSTSFEVMRVKLADSSNRSISTMLNLNIGSRGQRRSGKAAIRWKALKKVITAQEKREKRVAQGLR